MDPEQFQLFLKTVSDSLSKLSGGGNGGNGNVAPFEHFDSNIEKFGSYLERFENYAAMKNVAVDEKKAQLLLASIGPIHYNNLAAFLGPEKPLKNITYTDLTNNFSALLAPTKNVVVSQHYFFSCYQADSQTISEYVATLRRHLTDCEFYVQCTCTLEVSISETFLRTQFIRGIRDDWIRELLLQANLTKFDDILAKAVALEASRVQSKELGAKSAPPLTTETSTSDVSKVSRSRRSTSGNTGARPHQSRDASPPDSGRSRYRTPVRTRSFYRALGIDNLCFRCAKSSHKSNSCPAEWKKLKC